jgi:hypothetical protein
VSAENKYKWTVMVYLAGDNNLGAECVYALTEMQKVGSTDGEIAVVAQLDSGAHENTRIQIELDTSPGAVVAALNKSRLKRIEAAAAKKASRTKGGGQTIAEDQPSYFDVLREFVVSSMDDYSADHYMLVLSGHGHGTLEDFLDKETADKTYNLSIPALGGLLETISNKLRAMRKKEGQETSDDYKLDILGLDCCLMSMPEVGYALHKHVKVMIGAEGYETLAGWPYASVLSQVKEIAQQGGGDDEAVRKLAKQIVCGYIKYYTDYQAANVSVDQAACDLSECVTLSLAVKSLSRALRKYMPDVTGKDDEGVVTVQGEIVPDVRDALLLSHWEAQSYKNEQYTDLYDFCSLLKARTQRTDIQSACQNVMNAIRGAGAEKDAGQADDDKFRNARGFVLKSCYSGWVVQYSYGVSIYFPWSESPANLDSYAELYFAHDTEWTEFLRSYLAATKRAPRPGKDDRQTSNDWVLFGDLGDKFAASDSLTGERALLWTGHRDGSHTRDGSHGRDGTHSRDMENDIGTMKNPPTEYFQCACDDD